MALMAGCSFTSSFVVECSAIESVRGTLSRLLLSSFDNAQHSIRAIQQDLPGLLDQAPQELLTLAQLHMSSAADFMQTIKQLAPGVFVDGASTPNQGLLAQLDGSLLHMVATLTELQLFHLHRASTLVRQARKLLQHTASPRTPLAS